MNKNFKSILSKYGIVFVLILLIAALAIFYPNFRKPSNLMNCLLQACIFGILALGMTFVIIGKGTDLAVGSTLALCAVVCASFGQLSTAANRPLGGVLPEFPIIVPILVAIVMGVLIGLINGAFIAYTNIPAFIATLGMQTIARGFALLYSNGQPVSQLIPAFKVIGSGRIFGFLPVPVAIYLVCIVISWILLNNTRFGKRVYAIGGNMQAAEVSGINVKKMILLINAYMGLICGIAAIVFVGRTQSAHPGAATGYELTAIASTTIGGTSQSGGIGTIWGAVVGALIFSVLRNGMTIAGVPAYWQQIVEGFVVIIGVIIDMRKNARKA